MDAIGIEILIPAAAALVSLLAGIGFGRMGRRRRIADLEVRLLQREGQIEQLEAQLGASEEERDQAVDALAEYQTQVVGHFSQTSELLKEMTLQYRNIYQHLAQGAEDLCPDGALRIETHAPIDGLAETAGEPAGRLGNLALGVDDDDDGASVDAAHHESPIQVDPRPEA